MVRQIDSLTCAIWIMKLAKIQNHRSDPLIYLCFGHSTTHSIRQYIDSDNIIYL